MCFGYSHCFGLQKGGRQSLVLPRVVFKQRVAMGEAFFH